MLELFSESLGMDEMLSPNVLWRIACDWPFLATDRFFRKDMPSDELGRLSGSVFFYHKNSKSP